MRQLWYFIPLCIRRGLLISERNSDTLWHDDRLKFAWFLFASIYKPIIEQERSLNINDAEEMCVLTVSFLQQLISGKNSYKPKDINDMTRAFRNKIAPKSTKSVENKKQENDSNKKTSSDNSTKPKPEVKSKNFNAVFMSCTKMGLKQNTFSGSSQFTNKNSNFGKENSDMICPFSDSAREKQLPDESNWLNRMPKILSPIKDIEDLVEISKSDSELKVKNIYSVSLSTNLQESCNNCTYCYTTVQKSKKSELYSKRNNSNHSLFFDPVECFLNNIKQ
jgi:hypothetical protein